MEDRTNISIDELLRTLKKRAIPLQSETGAFIALETCVAIAEHPVSVTGRDVWIDPQGNVTIKSDKHPVSSEQAAGAVVDLLYELLLASAQGVAPLLMVLIDQETPGKERTLTQLKDQLDASLVPLNRGASQRVLARLVREVFREGERGSINTPVVPSYEELDRQFDELLAEGGVLKKKSERGDFSR